MNGRATKNTRNEGPGDDVLSQLSSTRVQEKMFPSPFIPFIIIVTTVVVSETILEAFLEFLLPESLFEHIIVDAGIFVLLILPIFFIYLYRPYKRHHEYHRRSQEEIELLSRKLINAQEEERKKLATDLHDDFGQVLTALQFGVETIKSSCPKRNVKDNPCLEQSEKLTQLISGLGDLVRSVSSGLHPAMLDEFGLESALNWQVEEYRLQRKDIEVKLASQLNDKRFPPNVELAYFRICQEALNNISKHAQANNVDIRLFVEDNVLVLLIKDDGVGFLQSELKNDFSKKSGIGLFGMRERVASLGGRLLISTKKGEGTLIQARIPLELRRNTDESNKSSGCR